MALVGALESAYSEGDIKAHCMFDDLNYYLEVVPESYQISDEKTHVF
jgi:Asp-tRNA(Asn)/Glu-tRNA(Gln) amidotransferase B subunit